MVEGGAVKRWRDEIPSGRKFPATTIILDDNYRNCVGFARTKCSIAGVTLNVRAKSRMLANSQSARARGRLQKISHPLVVYLQVTETEFNRALRSNYRVWLIAFISQLRWWILPRDGVESDRFATILHISPFQVNTSRYEISHPRRDTWKSLWLIRY